MTATGPLLVRWRVVLDRASRTHYGANTCSPRRRQAVAVVRSGPGRTTGGARVLVLGVDPGLTRCGVGVVAGAPAGRCQLQPRRGASPPRRAAPAGPAPAHLAAGCATLIAASCSPTCVAVERVFSQHNLHTRDGHGTGLRRCGAGRGGGWPAGRLAHADRGEGGGDGHRAGRQGAGRAHGQSDARPGAAPRGRWTPPTPWRWRSATSGAGLPDRLPRRPPAAPPGRIPPPRSSCGQALCAPGGPLGIRIRVGRGRA